MLALWNKNYIAYLLWPFSLLYRTFVFFRHKLYQFHIKKINKFPVPIIVIGNLTVGGTGKTPLVIEVVQFLQKKGWRPGVISRGYGGKAKHYPYQVHTQSNPREVGDEPLLIVRNTGCPTVIDPNRSRGVNTLLGKKNCNIVVSDDGLQHLALGRNIEIAVIDGQRRFGNGFCLPAGPLREPISRLKTVDFIIIKEAYSQQLDFRQGAARTKPPEGILIHEDGELNGNTAENSSAKSIAGPNEFGMLLVPEYFYQLIHPENKQNPDYFHGKQLHAVAGIGNPEQFFNNLRALGLTIIEHPFPDHHFFKPRDLNYGKDAIILMTEKDAVKCRGLVDARLWCLKAKATLDEAFFNSLLNRITQINNNPKSSSR
ncbi:tetraacyldisaccharide 4'-kinase [Candidatus Rickettsiella viridis]|uniref:Tetraacyldisaccharide 4'-kinase n=1 Tax=Candidatus Rickettsiella viridis TaxID=676208 RepID=A0A2Z5V6Y0_9COXI|nr:tetraacyldisaccharide 4'-kinase [Candidatus Rickettsiella viridis]BBB14867.1 tetraacyldisaccharide 4'-kinase [Candidatus Rickettsiella viridis]